MNYEDRIVEAQKEYDAVIDEMLLNLYTEELYFTDILTKFPRVTKSYIIALQSAIDASAGTRRAELSIIADTLMASTAAIISAVVNHRTRQNI